MANTDRVQVGRVVKPHGIHGELVVEPTGETLDSLTEGDRLWLGDDVATTLLGLRPHQGRWLVTVSECADRDVADALRGLAVSVDKELLPDVPDGEFYVDTLVGCVVTDAVLGELGTVRAVVPGGPHDFLEIDAANGPVLVPMVREWLVDVAPGERRISMRLPKGLMEATRGGAER